MWCFPIKRGGICLKYMHIYVSKWWNPSRWVLGITLSLFFMLTEHIIWASLVAQMVMNPPAMQGTWVQSLSCEDPLEEGMATQSSILAWRIPYGQRSLAGYSPWGHKESDMTERVYFTSVWRIQLKIWPFAFWISLFGKKCPCLQSSVLNFWLVYAEPPWTYIHREI